MSNEELVLRIVSMAAHGQSVRRIAARLHMPEGRVQVIVEAHGGPDLGALERASRELQPGREAAALQAQITAPSTPNPEPAPQEPGDDAPASGVATALAMIIAYGPPPLRRRATTLRRDLTALLAAWGAWHAEWSRTAAQRQELEAQLARIKVRKQKADAEITEVAARLRELGRPDVRPTGTLAQRREIRAWATAHGYECSARGIIPDRVMNAWRAAHPGED